MTMRAPFDAVAGARGVRLALLAVWLAVVAMLIAGHVPWRDEVRALRSLAAVAPSLSMLLPTQLRDVPGVAGVLALLLLATPFGLLRSPGGFLAGGAAVAGPIGSPSCGSRGNGR